MPLARFPPPPPRRALAPHEDEPKSRVPDRAAQGHVPRRSSRRGRRSERHLPGRGLRGRTHHPANRVARGNFRRRAPYLARWGAPASWQRSSAPLASSTYRSTCPQHAVVLTYPTQRGRRALPRIARRAHNIIGTGSNSSKMAATARRSLQKLWVNIVESSVPAAEKNARGRALERSFS